MPVTVSWQSQVAIVNDRLTWNDRVASTRSDSLGYWHLCAVPRDVAAVREASEKALDRCEDARIVGVGQ